MDGVDTTWGRVPGGGAVGPLADGVTDPEARPDANSNIGASNAAALALQLCQSGGNLSEALGNLAAVLASVRENGSIAYYASNGNREPVVPLGTLMAKNITLRGFVLPTSPHPDRKRAQSDLTRFIATPGRMLSVAARFPLSQAAAAHEAVEKGDKTGTVVVECAQ